MLLNTTQISSRISVVNFHCMQQLSRWLWNAQRAQRDRMSTDKNPTSWPLIYLMNTSTFPSSTLESGGEPVGYCSPHLTVTTIADGRSYQHGL